MSSRVFLIVLDSFGIGEMPDAANYGDVGSNTIRAVSTSSKFDVPNLKKLGLFNIDGVSCCNKDEAPLGSFGRFGELSSGKDTTTGHWEIAGLVSNKPFPTYPNGFPKKVIEEFERQTGRKTLCNLPYSGTEVIKVYGKESIEKGALIVYTSADSVFQIAAHEDVVPVDELYKYCEMARNILVGEHAVGRVIARPFIGNEGNYTRTSNRHDFSLVPPSDTMLNVLQKENFATISVGKIVDIFAKSGIGEFYRIKNNNEGMAKTIELQNEDFKGLCFVNLVDFDMLYGHRNDIDGYANALTTFDKQLGTFLSKMTKDDVLIITADHGCDPSTPSTDHSREYIPVIIYGDSIKQNINLGTRFGFNDISATILDIFNTKKRLAGKSFYSEVEK